MPKLNGGEGTKKITDEELEKVIQFQQNNKKNVY